VPVKKKTVINLDERIAKAHAEDGLDTSKPPPTAPVEAFGQTFRVYQDINVFNLIALDDVDDAQATAALVKLVKSLIHEDDRRAFLNAIASARYLNGSALREIITGLMEAASGEVPTTPPVGSGRSSRPKAAIGPSAAS
jgi:hypothetical protein